MSDPFPPPNPAAHWFRLVVWLMPASILFTTTQALDSLASTAGEWGKFWFLGWLVVNGVGLYALGVLNRRLSGPTVSSEKDSFSAEVTAFAGLQVVVIIPVVLLTVWLIRTLIGG